MNKLDNDVAGLITAETCHKQSVEYDAVVLRICWTRQSIKKDGQKLMKRCDGIKIIYPEYQHDCFFSTIVMDNRS